MKILCKKNYCSPRLIVHGNMDQVTLGTRPGPRRGSVTADDRYIIGCAMS